MKKEKGISSKEINVRFFLQEIEDLFFSCKKLDLEVERNFNPAYLSFGVLLNISASEEDQTVSIILDTNYSYLIEGVKQFVPVEYKCQFVFKIQNFDEVISVVDNNITSNEQIFVVLLGISISSLRGILREKLRSTILGKIYVPILDAQILFNQFVEDLQKQKNQIQTENS